MLQKFCKFPLLCSVLLFAVLARPVFAQASAYVPLDDNAYVYADALIARGYLSSLSQIERPYRVDEFRHAMARDTTQKPVLVQRLYTEIDHALTKYDPGNGSADDSVLHLSITPYAFVTAQTSGVRELMLPDSINSVRPGFGGIAVAQMGPFVSTIRAYDDSRLKDDPDFIGQKNRWYTGRMEDAYISAQFKYGEFFLGRMGRNWGPPQMDGLLLGHYAYTYDHLYMKLGVPAFHLSTIITRLDDNFRSDSTTIDTARRYFSIHQLTLRKGRFEGAVSEAVIYGGKTENFRMNYINPVVPYVLSEVLEKSPGNVLFGLDLAYRSQVGNFHMQGMLDDLTKNKCQDICAKPSSFAYTVTAEGLPFFGEQRLFAFYTMVSNLAYRNEEWYDTYMSQNVGLGRGYSDYDETRVGADLLVIPSTPVRLYLAYRRQGEGDYREPHPPISAYPTTRQFLAGVVQHTTRAGISFAGAIGRYVQVKGDVGLNHASNAMHHSGAIDNSIDGRVMLTVESPWRLVENFSQ